MEEAALQPRIAARAGEAFAALACAEWAPDAPDPSLALSTLDRWLGAVATPAAYTAQMMEAPVLGRLLLKVMGASSEIGSCLVQNPEFAGLCLDPSLIGQPLKPGQLEAAGQRMLAAASSYTHQLDRLRLLKQEVMVRIAVADQAGVWTPEQVWGAISTMADVLIDLARSAAWRDYAGQKGLDDDCPVAIVGMGKLGGQELNYSSDIDLVYVAPDDVDDRLLVHCIRYAEKLGRALSDRMGRGALFRVDMRLRPFGRSGDLAARMRAVEAYMDRYAEPWEHMALIRSRMVSGSPELVERWEKMRDKTCFQRPRSLAHIHSILRMRERLESISSERDIKRATGGIRDVEFGVQLLQLFFGGAHPLLRGRGTLQALQAAGFDHDLPLEPAEAAILAEGYRFLRGVEHQLQASSGRQTHELPENPEEFHVLARRLGYPDATPFEADLARIRAQISGAYQRLVLVYQPGGLEPRAVVRAASGPAFPEVERWAMGQPDPDALWVSLAENSDSLDRFLDVADRAPALLAPLRSSDAATELLLSGEVLEPPSRIVRATARAASAHWLAAAIREALREEDTFGADWSGSIDQILAALHKEFGCGFAMIALGSYADGAPTLHSDADLVFIAPAEATLRDAEAAAAAVLKRLADLRSQGSPLEADLRLRPEGRNGPLVANPDSLAAYARTRLEPWERIALSRARWVAGPAEPFQLVSNLVHERPLSSTELAEALRIKGRVEAERAKRQSGMLDIKLGAGGMDDCLWAIHLLALQTPGEPHESRAFMGLGSRLVEEGALGPDEWTTLSRAYKTWRQLRIRLALHGRDDSLLPLDGAKLAGLEGGGDAADLAERARKTYAGVIQRLLNASP